MLFNLLKNKHIYIFIIFFCEASLAYSFTPTDRISAPKDMKPMSRISWAHYHALSNAPSGSPEVNSNQVQASILQPVWMNENQGVQAGLRFGKWSFSPSPSTHVAEHPQIPTLYDTQVSAQFAQSGGNSKLFWGGLQIQSSSNKPFHSIHEVELHSTLAYAFEKKDHSQWSLLLNYANRRPFLNHIPLLGFIYHYSPSDSFRLTLGVPIFGVYWKFAPKWSINYFGLAPWSNRLNLAYSIFGPYQIGAGLQFQQSHYLLADRKDKREQFYYDERKIFLGLKGPISKVFYLDLESGYAFRRQFFFARRFSISPAQPVPLGKAIYLLLGISARY